MEMQSILYVDQDPTSYHELVDRLDVDSVNLIQATKSSEALRILQNQNICLLILDAETCSMPLPEILPIIHGINKHLPIIVVCGNNTPDLEKQIRTQKVFYYHLKNFGISDLELAVKNALDKRGSKRQQDEEGL